MDKVVVYIYNGILKKNDIMPFAATCMDLEIIILSKLNREKQTSYEFTHLCNLILKNDTDELIYKTSTDLTDIENKLMVAAADAAKSLQSCLTLCDPIDGSPPGFAVPVIL